VPERCKLFRPSESRPRRDRRPRHGDGRSQPGRHARAPGGRRIQERRRGARRVRWWGLLQPVRAVAAVTGGRHPIRSV